MDIPSSKTCEICGKIIEEGRDKEAFKRAKFCSQKCYWESLKGKTGNRAGTGKFGTKICEVCGKEFSKGHRTKEQWEGSKTCSMKCFHQSRVGVARNLSEEWKENITKANIIKGESFKGDKHWNWKGGITPENHLIRHGKEYNEWRKTVYKRDYWTCQICKEKIKHPIAHHIKSFNDYPELRFDIDNGITVCRKCHKIIHNNIGNLTRFKKGKSQCYNLLEKESSQTKWTQTT